MFVTRINQGPRLPSFSELVSSLAYEQDQRDAQHLLHQHHHSLLHHHHMPQALHPHPAMAPVPSMPQRPLSMPGPAILSLLPMDRQQQPPQPPHQQQHHMDSRQDLPLGSPLGSSSSASMAPQSQPMFPPQQLLASPGSVTPVTPASSITPATSVSSYNSSSSSFSKQEDLQRGPGPRLSSKRKHACKTCGRLFTTLGHLARHFRTHTGERKHVCPWADCGARFARQDNCMQHYKTHLNGKNKRR